MVVRPLLVSQADLGSTTSLAAGVQVVAPLLLYPIVHETVLGDLCGK